MVFYSCCWKIIFAKEKEKIILPLTDFVSQHWQSVKQNTDYFSSYFFKLDFACFLRVNKFKIFFLFLSVFLQFSFSWLKTYGLWKFSTIFSLSSCPTCTKYFANQRKEIKRWKKSLNYSSEYATITTFKFHYDGQ